MIQKQKQQGFSLLELIVAVGIFSIAATVVVGSFLSLLTAQRRAAANQQAMDNIRFAMDAMAKEIRVGSSYERGCADPHLEPGDDPDPCSAIVFNNPEGDRVVYRWSDTATGSVLEKAKNINTSSTCFSELGNPTTNSCIGEGFVSITDPRVRIDDVKMYIIGSATGDGLQPYALLNIEATVNPGRGTEETSIALQTAVSQLTIQR